jgi:hypothetical protein
MSARSDVTVGPVGLNFGTNIAITISQNEFILDSAKRGSFPQNSGVEAHYSPVGATSKFR